MNTHLTIDLEIVRFVIRHRQIAAQIRPLQNGRSNYLILGQHIAVCTWLEYV